MGLREWANKHPKPVAGIVSACLIACVAGVAIEMMGDRRPKIGVMPNHYFTIDDGKTVFEANGSNIPPFDYQGKTAVRVHLFEADGKRFVGYLERYTPAVREAKIARTITPQQEVNGRELKRPGEPAWLPSSDHAALAKILSIPKPPGTAADPQPVEP